MTFALVLIDVWAFFSNNDRFFLATNRFFFLRKMANLELLYSLAYLPSVNWHGVPYPVPGSCRAGVCHVLYCCIFTI